MSDNRLTLMQTTPGITFPNLSREPLATEGEATEGPDHINPHRSVEEREIVERYKRKRREREDDQLWKSGMDTDTGNDMGIDPESIEWVAVAESPTEGDDPYVFDDIDPDLPALEFDGPRF